MLMLKTEKRGCASARGGVGCGLPRTDATRASAWPGSRTGADTTGEDQMNDINDN